MKLINRTLLLLSIILFVLVSLWAVLFYFQLLSQVKTIVDQGLAHYKIIVIDKLSKDTEIEQNPFFEENNYILKQVSEDFALRVRDNYKDTLVFSKLKNTTYQTRLLTTAFANFRGDYYEMKLISNELNKGALLKKIAISLIWLYILLFVCIILVNNFVLKKTWQPFYELLSYLDKFRLDKEALPKFSKTNIEEFKLLNHSVKSLIETNIGIYKNQKHFIENVSHELQTPLAIGVNKLELLAGDKRLSKEQIEKIGGIIETFQRMSALNKSLLLFSKIENRQFIATKEVSFGNLFSKVIEDFTDFSKYKNIQINYIKLTDWTYLINPDLALILVMNLVKNSIIHNIKGGKVTITLNKASFTIENTGAEPELSSIKMFQRFNKKANQNSSTGLGLAIVKAITDVSGLVINYSYEDENHVFTVAEL